MTPDSPHRTRLVARAVSAALALGVAGCGQPLDLRVESAGSQDKAVHARPSGPSVAEEPSPTPLTPTPRADRSPPSERTIRAAPSFGDRRAGGPPTQEPGAGQAEVLEEGDSGDAVATLQQRLSALGYWVGPNDGVYGELTEQAVLAFQGWEDLTRDGRVGPDTRAALAAASRPAPDAGGDLIEVHLEQQVLLMVEDGRTAMALHVSTGSGERYTHPSGHEAVADTPVGEWEIGWRVDGWRQSDLGRLWRPAYFHPDGIAIHGYPEVPAHRASHGCVRVSMSAMDTLWAQGHVPEGTPVVVS